MRSQLFVDYAPIGGLGEKVITKAEMPLQPDPAWEQHPTQPDFERRMVNGRPETRLKPSVQNASPQSQAIEPKKEPPYCPEGWGGFQYHGADGKEGPLIKPATFKVDFSMMDVARRSSTSQVFIAFLREAIPHEACVALTKQKADPEVPSARELAEACKAATARNSVATIRFCESLSWTFFLACPPQERAAAIAAFNAIR